MIRQLRILGKPGNDLGAGLAQELLLVEKIRVFAKMPAYVPVHLLHESGIEKSVQHQVTVLPELFAQVLEIHARDWNVVSGLVILLTRIE